jgi:sulfide:quinone oxidoreductase
MVDFSVLICGGGIAGVEALLRLHRLAGQGLTVTLISPDGDLVYRPLTVVEPLDRAAARRYPIAQIVADAGARWIQDSLEWLDRHERVVHTSGGATLRYDALLLAIGAREENWAPFVDTFTSRDGGDLYRSVIADIETGRLTRLAFVLPPGPSWPLPLYELALMTATFARYGGHNVQITFAIADSRPLEVLGAEAGSRVTQLLSDLGITLCTGTRPSVSSPGHLSLHPGQPNLEVDRIVALPTLSGPNIAGIPGFAFDRFLHVDAHCRVLNTGGRIFAAGDATNLPIKQGGISAQQADTAAAGIVHLAGLGPASEPLRPRIDATLLTGAVPLYVSAHVIDGLGWRATLYDQPPWPAGEKIIAEELGPYLRNIDDERPAESTGPNPSPDARPLL